MKSRLPFQIDAKAEDSRARAARIQTLHGELTTPVFMPVGTQATVKGQTRESLEESGAQIVLANTYHLMLRPGQEVFERFGGIHRFMGWEKPVLTDSGGYQVYSLAGSRRIDEEGATFESYVDCRSTRINPEISIGMQRSIGSDIMMAFDQCIDARAGGREAREAMGRTHRWAVRSLAARGESPQALFGIAQGACQLPLRRESAEFLRDLPFDGYAIGGLAVGETRAEREDVTEFTTGYLPEDRPRYLMGVGTPIDLLEAVHRGVDMFDCILPQQFAQRGAVFTSQGKLQLRRTVYRLSEEPLDPQCACRTCRTYSRAYLHHLIKSGEVLGWHLLGLHNLSFYQHLATRMRGAILGGAFGPFYREWRERLVREDELHPAEPPRPKRRRQPPRELGDYEIRISPQGSAAIRQKSTGEVMHPGGNPMEEARGLYAGQSGLARKLSEEGPELVIWDVGLGAATNAMAVIGVALGTEGRRRALKLVSFENDLDSLKLAFKNDALFPHLRHGAPAAILREGYWSAPGVSWELRLGDFASTAAGAPAPDLIFYDPFSPKADSPLWTTASFERLRALLGEKACALYTYSASTSVRASLLFAGFHVASGAATGMKTETTIAATAAAARTLDSVSWLSDSWLARWERSGARIPGGTPSEEIPQFERAIREHSQFQPA